MYYTKHEGVLEILGSSETKGTEWKYSIIEMDGKLLKGLTVKENMNNILRSKALGEHITLYCNYNSIEAIKLPNGTVYTEWDLSSWASRSSGLRYFLIASLVTTLFQISVATYLELVVHKLPVGWIFFGWCAGFCLFVGLLFRWVESNGIKRANCILSENPKEALIHVG